MNAINKEETSNCFIKDYDCFPDVDSVIYFYKCTQGKDLMPKILNLEGNRIVFEYIDGIDGYEFIGDNNNILPIIITLSHNLSVETNNFAVGKDMTYEYRMDYMHQRCVGVLKDGTNTNESSKFVEYVLKCIEFFYSDSMNLWERHFGNSKRFILHGDLHPGNIIRDKKSGMWKAIDPIVTTAPIEYDYVRFIENMTFSNIIAKNKSRFNDEQQSNEKILHGFIDEILLYVNSTYERFAVSLYIDSLLRLMETVIDNERTTRFKDEVEKSLRYCCEIKEIIG